MAKKTCKEAENDKLVSRMAVGWFWFVDMDSPLTISFTVSITRTSCSKGKKWHSSVTSVSKNEVTYLTIDKVSQKSSWKLL